MDLKQPNSRRWVPSITSDSTGASMMDLDERVKYVEQKARSRAADSGLWLHSEITPQTLLDLIADWRRLKADNERLRHVFSLQAMDDVE